MSDPDLRVGSGGSALGQCLTVSSSPPPPRWASTVEHHCVYKPATR